jgi:hypothetical protein
MENAIIVKNDQVIRRRQMRGGTAIDIGSVVRIEAGGQSAFVHFPTLNSMVSVPISELQKTVEVFGGVRVHPSPARRTINTLIR